MLLFVEKKKDFVEQSRDLTVLNGYNANNFA